MTYILRYLAGAVVAVLPPLYRPRLDAGVGLISGIAEMVVALLVLILRAISWTQARADVDFHNDLVWAGTAIPGSGIFLLAAFWVSGANGRDERAYSPPREEGWLRQ